MPWRRLPSRQSDVIAIRVRLALADLLALIMFGLMACVAVAPPAFLPAHPRRDRRAGS